MSLPIWLWETIWKCPIFSLVFYKVGHLEGIELWFANHSSNEVALFTKFILAQGHKFQALSEDCSHNNHKDL